MKERLQKILSQAGIASRRQAEQMIEAGRVRLNGDVVTRGQKADPDLDLIEVDGLVVQASQRPQLIYLLLHKPAGVLSTCADPWRRPTVIELLSDFYQAQGLHPVGRLDFKSTGALLLTNDGDLTYRLTHPRHHIPKTYQVWVAGHPSASSLQAWRQGVMLGEQPTLPAQVQVLEQCWGAVPQTCLEIILKEGRNRQIRRVAKQLGHPVLALHRTAIGSIQLKPVNAPELPPGRYRPLNLRELDWIKPLTANKQEAMTSPAGSEDDRD